MYSASTRLWVVIPAAGVGSRMTGGLPKQYLRLAGRTVLEWSMAPFLEREDIAGIVVALAPDDAPFSSLPVSRDVRVRTAVGGAQRADSVLRALQGLHANNQDWVLVHDAARPCLNATDLARLVDELAGHDVGGLLAAPVVDTLKSADATDHVSTTVARNGLWRALTPQMFRFDLLLRALTSAAETNTAITDEASAVERLGLRPKLVAGRNDNIKITVAEDLAYAECVLRARTTN